MNDRAPKDNLASSLQSLINSLIELDMKNGEIVKKAYDAGAPPVERYPIESKSPVDIKYYNENPHLFLTISYREKDKKFFDEFKKKYDNEHVIAERTRTVIASIFFYDYGHGVWDMDSKKENLSYFFTAENKPFFVKPLDYSKCQKLAAELPHQLAEPDEKDKGEYYANDMVGYLSKIKESIESLLKYLSSKNEAPKLCNLMKECVKNLDEKIKQLMPKYKYPSFRNF